MNEKNRLGLRKQGASDPNIYSSYKKQQVFDLELEELERLFIEESEEQKKYEEYIRLSERQLKIIEKQQKEIGWQQEKIERQQEEIKSIALEKDRSGGIIIQISRELGILKRRFNNLEREKNIYKSFCENHIREISNYESLCKNYRFLCENHIREISNYRSLCEILQYNLNLQNNDF